MCIRDSLSLRHHGVRSQLSGCGTQHVDTLSSFVTSVLQLRISHAARHSQFTLLASISDLSAQSVHLSLIHI
eukprot:9619471-Alexandrium_andersonii.AAC.1